MAEAGRTDPVGIVPSGAANNIAGRGVRAGDPGSGPSRQGNEPAVRVVVTGATGNVGTALLRALAADDAVDEIIGVARRVPSRDVPKVRWRALDVATADLHGAVSGADAVVHLAWLFQPTHDPATTWRANVLGSLRVLEAVQVTGVPTLVTASSVGAYAPGHGDLAVDESWPTHSLPVAAYGREKSYLERVLDTFELRHPEVRVVRMRPSFIFQATAATSQRRIFLGPFFPQRVLRPGLLPVLPDVPGLRFQALHADDVADAYRRALHAPVRGAFNLAHPQVVRMADIAELLGTRTVTVPAEVVRLATRAAWNLHLVPASPGLIDLFLSLPLLDPSRAERELGWEARISSLDAVAIAVRAMRDGIDADTPSLAASTSGPLRLGEVLSGVGQRP
jgi:UDP-glucose 4-epimerase